MSEPHFYFGGPGHNRRCPWSHMFSMFFLFFFLLVQFILYVGIANVKLIIYRIYKPTQCKIKRKNNDQQRIRQKLEKITFFKTTSWTVANRLNWLGWLIWAQSLRAGSARFNIYGLVAGRAWNPVSWSRSCLIYIYREQDQINRTFDWQGKN